MQFNIQIENNLKEDTLNLEFGNKQLTTMEELVGSLLHLVSS